MAGLFENFVNNLMNTSVSFNVPNIDISCSEVREDVDKILIIYTITGIVRDRTTENKIRLSANAYRGEYDYYVSSINIDSEKDIEYGIEQLHNQFVSQIQEQIELINKRINSLRKLLEE